MVATQHSNGREPAGATSRAPAHVAAGNLFDKQYDVRRDVFWAY